MTIRLQNFFNWTIDPINHLRKFRFQTLYGTIYSSFVILNYVSNRSKKHLLTDIARRYDVGEIRYKSFGCCRQQAPYNIYYTTEIKKVLDRNIPLSDLYSNNASCARPTLRVKVYEEPVVEVNNSGNINIDIKLKDTDIINYNSMVDITDEQKEAWLWQEYYSKQQLGMEGVIW